MKSRKAIISTAVLIALAASLTACDPATPAVTVTALASPSANPSATSATPSPTPPAPAPSASSVYILGFGDEHTIASADGASYTGCSPGSQTLPTGVYLGYTSQWNTQEVHFDLVCLWTGDEADAHMIADGVQPDPYLEDEWYITNDNPTIRVVPIAQNVTVPAKKCDSDTIYPLADVIADPGGTVIYDSPPYLIRIYVTDGVIYALACHFLP